MFSTLGPGAIGIRGLGLEDSIDLAQDTGFAGVTIDIREVGQVVDAHGIDHVRGFFASAGVRPGNWGIPVGYREDDRWQSGLRALPRFAALGRELEAPWATTGVMPYSDERPYDENFAWHVERLRPIAEALHAEGCRLGIEFIGPKTFRAPYRHEFVYTLGGIKDLAAAIGTGNVGVLLDAWHLYTSGGTLADLDGLDPAFVVAVHVNDAPAGVPVDEQIDNVRTLPLETGVIDVVGFMGKLREIGVDGPVMPEPFSRRIEDLAANDPVAAARETARSMAALWQAAGLA